MKKLIFCLLLIPISLLSQTKYFPWSSTHIQNSFGSSTPAIQGSDIGMDGNKDKIYFVGNDSRIRSYYPNGGQYQEGVLNYNAPLAFAKTGIVSEASGNIIYVSTDGNINILRANNGWHHDQINHFPHSPPYVPARNNSKLVLNEPNGHIRINYIGIDNLVHYVEWNGSGYWDTGVLVSYANPVRAGSRLLKGNYGKIYYIDIYNDVQALYPNNGSNIWGVANISSNAYPVKQGSDFLIDPYNKLFYVATDSKIHALYHNNSQWYGGAVDNSSYHVKGGTGFTLNKGNLIYMGTDNIMYSTFYNQCDWETTILNDNSNGLSFSTIKSFYHNSNYGKSFFFDTNGILYSLTPGVDDQSDFVYIKKDRLWLKDKPFNIKGVNYNVDFNKNTVTGSPTYGEYYLSPFYRYIHKVEKVIDNPTDGWNRIDTDFARLKSMGINTIRLTGMGSHVRDGIGNNFDLIRDEVRQDKLEIPYIEDCYGQQYTSTVNVPKWNSGWPSEIFTQNFVNNTHIPLLRTLLQKAADNDLKVLLLLGPKNPNKPRYFSQIQWLVGEIAEEFAGDPTLMAIDLSNEPGDSWNGNTMTKDDVCRETQGLYNAIRYDNNSGALKNPNVLITMGLHPEDVDLWDPTIVALDFINFHIYVPGAFTNANSIDLIEKLQKQYYYIQKYMKIPWIVGETSFRYSPTVGSTTGHLNQGPKSVQEEFMRKSLDFSVKAGSSGLMWWSYHDVYSPKSINHPPTIYGYEGLIYNENDCRDPDVEKEKSIVSILKNFNNYCHSTPLPKPQNYYGITGPINYSAYIKDKNNVPITNAIIIVQGPNGTQETFSKNDGSFDISYPSANKLEISAPGYHRIVDWNPNLGTYSRIYKLFKVNNCNPSTLRKKSISYQDANEYSNSEVLLYPNPTNSVFNLNGLPLEIENFNLEVFNAVGQLVYQTNKNINNRFNINAKEAGMYYVRVSFNQEVKTLKVMVK